MVNNANNTKSINEASRKIREFLGLQDGSVNCGCTSFGTHAIPLDCACMEGEALCWYTGLDEEVKDNLDETFEALFEEFVPWAAFQAELEKEYLKLWHNRGQSVNRFGRDLMLLVGEMDDPASLAKQIVHLKKAYFQASNERWRFASIWTYNHPS